MLGVRWGASTIESDDDGHRLIPADPLIIAREWLMEHARVVGGTQFALKYWAEKWWWYERGRYVERAASHLRSNVWHWLAGLHKRLRRKNAQDVIVPFNPGPDYVESVLKALMVDCGLVGVDTLPAWVPPAFSMWGVPMWGSASGLGMGTEPYVQAGKPAAKDLIFYADGGVDLARWAATGRVPVVPATPDLMNTTRMPYPLPRVDLEAMAAGTLSEEAAYEKHCPKFFSWLQSVSTPGGVGDADERWARTLQLMLGDTLDSDRTIEKMFGVLGPTRSGKDTLADAIDTLLGIENVAPLTFADFEDRFGLWPVVGKRAAVMREAHVGKFEAGNAVERLKLMSGQSRFHVRDLHQSSVGVRFGARVWMMMNNLPTSLRDNSSAFANRFVMLPMTRSFLGKEDPSIKAGIPLEGPGITLFAMMGIRKLRQMPRRRVPGTKEGEELLAEFVAASSPLSAFVSECLVTEGEAIEVEFGDLYHVYAAHCKEEGREAMGKSRFALDLRSLVPMLRLSQPVRGGRRPTVYLGVALRDDLPPSLRVPPPEQSPWTPG